MHYALLINTATIDGLANQLLSYLLTGGRFYAGGHSGLSPILYSFIFLYSRVLCIPRSFAACALL